LWKRYRQFFGYADWKLVSHEDPPWTQWKTAQYLYLPRGLLFGHWFAHFFFEDERLDREVKRIFRDHIRFHWRIFELASGIVADLPPFNAMHVRRNDFQYTEVRHIPPEKIIENTLPALNTSKALYIATDEKDPSFLQVWRNLYNDSLYALGNFTKYSSEAPPHWLGVLEMVVCTQADIFISSRFSTFSGFIVRMRAFMNLNHETHFTTDKAAEWMQIEREVGGEEDPRRIAKYNLKKPTWLNGWFTASWGRDFSEAWNFGDLRLDP